MKIRKILLVLLMILLLIFPSIASTLSYAEDNIISKQNEIKEENKQTENMQEDNNESNQEENNNRENSNVTDIGNEAEENIANNQEEENTKNENNEIRNVITTNENEQLMVQKDEKSIPEGVEIEEGIYYIRTKLNEKQVLDVEGQSIQNSANVQIWKESEEKTDNQKFKIEKTEDGYYKIEALHSGKVLDVFGAKTENCTNVQQYEYNGSNAQKWQIVDAGNGYVSFISLCNGLYLDIAGASTANGTNVQVYETNGTDSQKFKLDMIEDGEQEKPEQIEVEEGTYYIRTKLDEKQVLDVEGQSIQNSANVQIWKESEEKTENQMFKIEKTEDGYYKIEALHSGKVLDVFGAKTENCTNVQQYEYNGSNAQKWQIVDAGNGYVSFISVCNGLYLDIAGASTANGTNVQVYETNGTDSQKFKLDMIEDGEQEKPEQIEVEEGTYYIRTKLDEKQVLDVEGQSKQNSANVQIWKESEEKTDNQKFKIEKTEDGYYKIEALHSGKVLDVFGAKTENCTNVQQYEYNGSNAQKWKIVDAGNGYVSFVSLCNGLYLDIAGANSSNGTNVQVYETNKTDSQKFKLDKIEEIIGTQTIEDGTYMIKTFENNEIGFDIESFSRQDKANLQLWTESAVLSKNQRFIITYQGNGYYQIIAQHSGKSLNVSNNGMIEGTNVEQYTINNSNAQKWIIKENEDGSYSIISKLNELCMDITGGKSENGANIELNKENGNNSQKFIFEKVEKPVCDKIIEDGIYKISTALNSNMFLDITDGSYQNGARLQLWGKNVLQQQKFEITYNEEGYYEIKSVNSGKLLDVKNGSNSNGTNVQQYEKNNTDYQKWIIQDAGNGYYYILSRGAEAYLDVTSDNVGEGTKLQIYDGDQSTSQKFKFEKTEIMATDDTYNIVTALDTNKVLDIDLPTSNLQIWELNTQSNNQKFKLECIEEGIYKIICRGTNKVLTVSDNDNLNIIQSDDTDSDNQKWKIEVAENGYYYIKSKSTNLYLEISGANSTNGTKVCVNELNNTNCQKFKFKKNTDDSDFLSLDETKYPGYKEALRKLQEQHPNWIIKIDYTGLDWNTVLNNEDVLITGKDGNVSARSLTQYTDQWRSGDPTQYEEGWYRASRAAIAYMMDPRNSFDDEYVFQFQELATSQGTYSEIATMIDGTFLTKYEGTSNTDSVINSILNSAQMYNVSPYHLVSRMLQEQGRDGGSLNGYLYRGRTVYNLFNIGASNSATASSIENGAAYAYNHHWFTPETCIEGSAEFLARDYISIGQSTLYYQKYDVVGDELYTHQYMTNIRAANDEGQRMGKDYKENGLIDLPFEFTIPVYENMPSEPSPRPSGTTPW